MELRLQIAISLAMLLSICVISNGYALREDACANLSPSSCSCFSGDSEFELECPSINSEITLRVIGKHVNIDCTHNNNNNRKIYTLFPNLKLSNLTKGGIERVKFKNCPLPEGTTIKGVLVNKLGIDRPTSLTLSVRSDTQMRREQLSNLNSLRRISFNGPISELPEDTFRDVSNITSLELRSINAHLPLNIFENLTELTQLEMISNNFSHLTPGILRNLHKLERLHLWSNNLKNLTKDSFVGVSKVTDLDLNSNNMETLHPDIFDALPHMEIINLSGNHFRELPAGLFKMNKNLRLFRLNNNRVDLRTLPSELLADQKQLQEVEIRCNLQYLPEDLFNGSSEIMNISLNMNRLATLPARIFDSQTKLEGLDLSDNQLSELPDNLFSNAKSLYSIRLSHNNLREIPERLFFELPHLTELYVDNNQLTTIHRLAFQLTNLRVLHLQNNHLDFVPYMFGEAQNISRYSPFKTTNGLVELNLRNNSMKYFLDTWNFHNTKLENLDLSYNEISQLSIRQIMTVWTQSITVNLTHNHIKNIVTDELDYLDIRQTDAPAFVDKRPNIQWKWILNYNPIDCDCKIFYFVKLLRENPTAYKNTQIVTNKLRCAGPMKMVNSSLDNLQYQDLICPLDSLNTSTKYCPTNCRCWIREFDRTGIFNCSNANLTRVPTLPMPNKNDGLAKFKRYELIIENNRITSLPNGNDAGYNRVTKLIARNNLLKHISNEDLPSNLDYLDISKNYLQKFDGLQHLNTTKTALRMILADNPWDCTCDNVFMKYVRSHSNHIDYNNITCNDHSFIRDKSDGCPIDTLLILACILLGLFGLFIGAVIALYYKYQEEIAVWFYARNLCTWLFTEEEVDKDKRFDIFFSFSHKDEEFVREQLVPELESGPHPFKICLHFRDLVVGEFIPNQISKSVEESRRTVVVLSKNFIDSIWGRMEFRVAHKNALAEGRTRLIVIVYGDIGEIKTLDPELQAYLKTNTYIKWGDPLFFDRLRYALPHRTNFKSKGLFKSTMKSSIDDKLELIKPQAVTPPVTTPPAEQAGQNLIGILNGLNGHVNSAFIINSNARQSDV